MARGVNIRFEIRGIEEMRKALDDLPTKYMRTAPIQKALLRLLAPVEATAKALAPVRSGKLRDRIDIAKGLSRRQRRGRRREKGLIEAFVGASPARHAHLVEFGTKERAHKSGKSTGAAAAKPFMRPAWDAHKGQLLDQIGEALWAEIEAAAAKAARRAAKKGK